MMRVVLAPLSGTPLSRFNPAAKLGAAFVVMVGLLVTADLVSASAVIVAEILVLPASGVRMRTLAVRAWPLVLGAAGLAVANLVASAASSAEVAALSLRLVAIALPGVLVFLTTDAVDLADSLVQQARCPARFAYGALAALRLLPLISDDWATIQRARRARGIDAGRSPVAKSRLFVSGVYALLVAAIRRAVRLAAAMDSRGFDSRRPRTCARRQSVTRRDWYLLAAAVVVVGGANALAAVAGTWHPLVG